MYDGFDIISLTNAPLRMVTLHNTTVGKFIFAQDNGFRAVFLRLTLSQQMAPSLWFLFYMLTLKFSQFLQQSVHKIECCRSSDTQWPCNGNLVAFVLEQLLDRPMTKSSTKKEMDRDLQIDFMNRKWNIYKKLNNAWQWMCMFLVWVKRKWEESVVVFVMRWMSSYWRIGGRSDRELLWLYSYWIACSTHTHWQW